jgi:CheY-like chemotaxis protein
MDGYEATRHIRERENRENLPPIPILALTANTTREDMARTRAEGFDGHLSKPIRKNELLAAIAWYSRRSPGPRT